MLGLGILLSFALCGPADQAAQRALDRIAESTTQWKPGCPGCHHTSFPALAFASASERGLRVPLEQHRTMLTGMANRLDAALQGFDVVDVSLSEAPLLLGAEAAGMPRTLATELRALRIARWQAPDGRWATFDARPPASSSVFTSTAYSVRAVAEALPFETEKRERLAKAAAWLRSAKTVSTEDAAFQVLGLLWAGAQADPSALEKRQNRDGGWGQLPGLASEAYSTGQALYAMSQAGRKGPAFKKGIAWLLQDQKPDGSWHVRTWIHTPAKVSPPYMETGFPYGRDQILSIYGSTWATLALLETLPKKQTVPRTTLPADPEWARIAAFGTTDELRRRLDSGLDPNLATEGGTSLLMFAIADEAKVKLLLERGAKADYKAKAGYTPLIAAAVNHAPLTVLKMLLEKGAEVNPGPGTRNNATPLIYAVATGDEPAVRLLLDKGANLRKRTLLAGVVSVDPITNASSYEHTGIIRLLVERGVDINEKDEDGMTQLAWAFLGQRPALVRTLLSLGATRDTKDKFGLSPAGHVKGIDYASPAIVQLARQ